MTKEITAKENEDAVEFEEALQQTGVGRYNIVLFVLSVCSLLAAALELFGNGIVLSTSKCDLELDVYKRALIGSAPMLGVVASAHFWGYMADTRGRKYTLRITMLGTALFSVISSFSNHWIFMLVFKFIAAAFASGTNAVTYAFLGEETPISHRARFLLYACTGTMLSQASISLYTFVVMKNMSFDFYIPFLGFNYRPWRLLAATFGLTNGFIYLLYHVLAVESPKYFFAKGEDAKGLASLKKMFKTNTGKSDDLFTVTKVHFQEKVVKKDDKTNVFQSMWNQTVPLFDRDNLRNMLIVSYMSISVYSIGPPYLIWVPAILDAYGADLKTTKTFCEIVQKNTTVVVDNSTYAFEPELCDDGVSGFTLIALTCIAAFFTSITASSVVLAKFMDKKWILVGVYVICTVLTLVMNMVPGIGGIVMFVLSLALVLAIGIVTTYAVELFPTYLRAMAVSVTMMIGRAFSFIVINLIGPQLEHNCNNFLYAMTAFIFSGAIVGLTLPGEKKKKKVADKEAEP